jgi:hypothetical protein
MVYVKNFVAAVKVGNKYIRDENGEVKIPFNSEYKIFLKNMDSRKAVVKISIDGKNVTESGIVIHGNSSVDLNGYIENGKLKNCFKFIQVSSEIEEFRGITPEDGLIRVEITWEKKKVEIPYTIYTTPQWEYTPWKTYTTWYDYKTSSYSITNNDLVYRDSNHVTCSYSNNISLDSLDDNGITVKGNEINQSLNTCYVDTLENDSTVIVLKLIGYNGELKTSRDKIQCKICGRINKSGHKFCGGCGTYLE